MVRTIVMNECMTATVLSVCRTSERGDIPNAVEDSAESCTVRRAAPHWNRRFRHCRILYSRTKVLRV